MPTARRGQPVAPAPAMGAEAAANQGLDMDDFMRPSDFGGGGYYDERERDTEPAQARPAPSRNSVRAAGRAEADPAASYGGRFTDDFGFSLDSGNPAAAMLENAKRNIGRKASQMGPLVEQQQAAPPATTPSNKARRSAATTGHTTPRAAFLPTQASTAGTPAPFQPQALVQGRASSASSSSTFKAPQPKKAADKSDRMGWRGTTSKACGWKSLEQIHEEAAVAQRRPRMQGAEVAPVQRPQAKKPKTPTAASREALCYTPRSLSETYPPPAALQMAREPPPRQHSELQCAGPAGPTGRPRNGSMSVHSIREQLTQTKLRLEACLGGSFSSSFATSYA